MRRPGFIVAATVAAAVAVVTIAQACAMQQQQAPPPGPVRREQYTAFLQEAKSMMDGLEYRMRNCETQRRIFQHIISQLRRMPNTALPPKELIAKLDMKVPGLSPHDPTQQDQVAVAVGSYLAIIVEGVSKASTGSAGRALPGAVADQLEVVMDACVASK